MALPSSGAISLLAIQTEFGGPSSPIPISSYYRGGSYVTSNNTSVPTSGQISFNQFWGAQALLPTQSWSYDGTAVGSGGTPSGQTTYTWSRPSGGIAKIRFRMWGGGGGGRSWPGGIQIGGYGAYGGQFDLTDSTSLAKSSYYLEVGNRGMAGMYGGSGGGGFPDNYRRGSAGGFSRVRYDNSGGTVLATVAGGNGSENVFVASPNSSNSFDAICQNVQSGAGGSQGNYAPGGYSDWGGGGGSGSSYPAGTAGNGGGTGGQGNQSGFTPGGGGGSCDGCWNGSGGVGRITVTINP